MRYPLLILVVICCTPTVIAAPPPDLPYLTDLPADQVVHLPSVGRRVILASDASQANQTQVWALLSDPSIIRYFQNAKRTVVLYLDAETHEDPYLESLSVRKLPSVVVSRSRGGMLQRRLETFEKPYELIRWLEDAQSGRHWYDQLYRRVAVRPDDLGARFELIKELNHEDMQESADKLFPWMFNRNELWFQYEQGKQGDDFEEEQFRAIIFAHIMRIRTTYQLFMNPKLQDRASSAEAKEIDDWVEQDVLHRRAINGGGRYREGLGLYASALDQTKYIQARCDQLTATDRDRFIYNALTAEGDDWQALIEQYTNDTP